MMKLYEKIKERRKKLGLTQEELAAKLHYTSGSTIAKIEVGKIDLTQTKIVEFAKALETTPSYLMGWEDEEKEEKIVENYQKLSEENKIKVENFINYILYLQNNESKNKKR